METDTIKIIIKELKDAGFKLISVERHLWLAKSKLNNYRFGMTSFTDAEKSALIKYHKAAMKLAGVNYVLLQS